MFFTSLDPVKLGRCEDGMEDTYGSTTWDATNKDPASPLKNENLVVMTNTEIEVDIACAKSDFCIGKLSWLEVDSYLMVFDIQFGVQRFKKWYWN